MVTDTARRLARDLLEPPMAWMVRPAFRVLRLVTIGLLPPAVRAGYGYAWTSQDGRALARRVRMLRGLRRILPRAAWEWPAARRLGMAGHAAGSSGAREGAEDRSLRGKRYVARGL